MQAAVVVKLSSLSKLIFWLALGQYVITDVWGEPPNSTGWETSLGVSEYTSTCGGETIIGGYEKFGANDWAKKTYSDLPAHTNVSLQFDIYFIDSWDGAADIYLVYVDNDNEYSQSHHTAGNSSGNVCGSIWADNKTTVTIGPIPHNSTSITLKFSSTLNSGPEDESFGFKNIKITVDVICTPACLTCFGDSESECYTCADGWYLNGTTCLNPCPWGYWGDDTVNVCRECTENMENAPPPCVAVEEANYATTVKKAASVTSEALATTTSTLQSANAISGTSLINLLLSLSAIESIANMQYLNVNHSAMAVGAYSGLSSSLIPNWIANFNHLSEENVVFNYGIFEKNQFSALYLDNNGDFLTELLGYGCAWFLTGVICSITVKENLARTKIGKVYAITIGLIFSNVFGHVQTLTLFSLIQILKISLVVDAYTGISYILAYLTLTSVAGLYVLCFIKLKAIFDKKFKSKYTIRSSRELEAFKDEKDEWNEMKYEMLYEDFNETSPSSFFFAYWIAAFNIVHILLIFTLQSVPVIQCLSVVVVAITFTIFSAIVKPMKKKSANFIHFSNFACILVVSLTNLAVAIKEAATGDYTSNKLAGWVIFVAVMANTGVNILIGFGGMVIQLFQIIKKKISKAREKEEKNSKTDSNRSANSAHKKGDVEKPDSSKLLVQKSSRDRNSVAVIDLTAASLNPGDPSQPLGIKRRKIIVRRVQPFQTPNNAIELNSRSLSSQAKRMSLSSFQSTRNWIFESSPRFEQINFNKNH